MENILSELWSSYYDYRARRDAAQSKIDVLEDLQSVLENYKLQISNSSLTIEEVAITNQHFAYSVGNCVDSIRNECHPDSCGTVHGRLMDYYDSLDTLVDQINLDLCDLRAEKRANIGFMDDVLDAIDEYWTQYTNSSN